ncbi:MAG: Gfo/Idh/MocA family oxidoreductase [Pirellulales bacterium]
MKLRVGLVGLGPFWETRHRPALRALADRFEVRAVCCQVAHHGQQAAKEFGAVCVDGYHALAQRRDVDAVLMLSRQWYGPLPVLAACDAGKAVYSAGGLGTDVAEASRVQQRIEEAGIAYMPDFPRRQAPATLRLKELICTRLGPPSLLFCHLRAPARAAGDASDRTQGDAGISDLIELVDWCSYVVGRSPASVLGLTHGDPAIVGGDAYQMMSLDFPAVQGVAQVTAQVSCGRYVPADWEEAVTFRPPAAMQIRCRDGLAFVDLPNTLIWFDQAGRHMEKLDSDRPVGEQSLCQFHRAVTSLVRNTASLDDAYRAVIIADAAMKSHESGRRVNVAELL